MELEEEQEETTLGGYDYFFLEEPPSDVICPICRLVAREPHQVSCCGKIYCKECFFQLQSRSKWTFRCANCREDEPETFPDRKTAGQINSLRVACTKRDYGCIWRGALRELKVHHSRCEYADINCPFSSIGCPSRPLRKDIEQHEEDNIRQHLNLAMKHITELDCLIKHDRQEQEDKIMTAMADIKTLFQSHKKEVKKQFDKRIEQNEDGVRKKLDTLKDDIITESRPLPLVFKLADFSDLQDDDEDWHSPAFITHVGGYRMSLRVYTNGCSDVRGTHLSLYVYLMRSDHDQVLEWPFRGTIHVELLNQLEDDNHYFESIKFNSKELKNYNARVKSTSNLGVTGLGKSKFISQEELGYNAISNCQYLKDDSLYFRVSKVDVESCSKPWLMCIESQDNYN